MLKTICEYIFIPQQRKKSPPDEMEEQPKIVSNIFVFRSRYFTAARLLHSDRELVS